MSINLITGTPGSGKSLYCVEQIYKFKKSHSDRKISICGLDGQLPGIDLTRFDYGFDWRDLEDGTFIVIDECHYHWPTRLSSGHLPQDIQDLTLHRHRGFDFWLITQHPMQLDIYVRRQVTQHVHLVRRLARDGSKVFRSNEFVQHETKPDDREKDMWTFPKHLYGSYLSSSLHDKARVTFAGNYKKLVYGLAVFSVFVFAFGFWLFGTGGRVTDGGLSIINEAPIDQLPSIVPYVPPAALVVHCNNSMTASEIYLAGCVTGYICNDDGCRLLGRIVTHEYPPSVISHLVTMLDRFGYYDNAITDE